VRASVDGNKAGFFRVKSETQTRNESEGWEEKYTSVIVFLHHRPIRIS